MLALLLGCALEDQIQCYEGCAADCRDVVYEVTCTSGLVSITIENSDGGVSQFADVATPWTYEFTGDIGDFVYVSAQNLHDYGTVTATIYQAGEIFKTSTSEGAYAIASAYGSLE